MKVRKLMGVLIVACAAWQLMAASLRPPDPECTLWLRTPAVAPYGSRIALTQDGQIWVVATNGGETRSLTSGTFYSHKPAKLEPSIQSEPPGSTNLPTRARWSPR